jgi:WhiB family redox-sensing transcriptional regulator
MNTPLIRRPDGNGASAEAVQAAAGAGDGYPLPTTWRGIGAQARWPPWCTRSPCLGPARRVCAACPVRQACLYYAITNRIVHGIWGGLTERERRALRSGWVRAARRERDEAIAAASADGYTKASIGRAFGLTRTSVSRALSRDSDRRPS